MTADNKQVKTPAAAAATLSLFASVSTLLCCALPALLVAVGLGAVVAGLVSNVPGLIWISQNKTLVFSAAGMILTFCGLVIWNSRRLPCPADPVQARSCSRLRRFSVTVYVLSLILFAVGFFFAFLLKFFWEI